MTSQTNQFLIDYQIGTYKCACCSTDLFSSDHKFASGTGWPSFFETVTPDSVTRHTDRTFGMTRIEVLCKNCDAHLGIIVYLLNNVSDPHEGLYLDFKKPHAHVKLVINFWAVWLLLLFKLAKLFSYLRSCFQWRTKAYRTSILHQWSQP